MLIHINENILDDEGNIDQYKIDLVARMGGNWYSRSRNGLFEVEKPLRTLGIGVDKIPQNILSSDVLTGNDLGLLGNVEKIPEYRQVVEFKKEFLDSMIENTDPEMKRRILHEEAKHKLSKGKILEAWMTLLSETI